MNRQAYVIHKGTMCVIGSAVIDNIINKWMWADWGKRYGLAQRGGNGRSSLIAFDLIPERHRERIVSIFGSPYDTTPTGLRDRLVPDEKAATYYSALNIDLEKQTAYTASAMVMNAITDALTTETTARNAHGKGIGDFWKRAVKAVADVKFETGHTLNIKNHRALKRKWEEYYNEGKVNYGSIVHGLHGKQNAQKVTYSLEKLLMSIYCTPNRPFTSDVHTDFLLFMDGNLEVHDKDTGEVLDPKNYTNADGSPLTISGTTVWNYLNMPHNRAIVDSLRMGHKRFNDTHRPHMDRHLPNYSFSKISMDDRDLPRKMANGNRVKAYYAYDVASGAVIGRAYSQTKDHELVIECFRDMFRMMHRNGWGMPMEIEVEFHLLKEFRSELEELFPYVRFCATSQEKRAEHFNRSKKYGVEKKLQAGVGRWWARSEAYQVDEDVVEGQFVGKRYDYDQLVADDLSAIDDYNQMPHHKPKRFPGMNRWQVLNECMNPKLAQINKPVLLRMIGNRTVTTIRRNSKFQVNHAMYDIPSVKTLAKLGVNNYQVEAYWLRDDEGKVPEVHIWQGEKFIATCQRRETYNEARGERTQEDWDVFHSQKRQAKEFDEFVKEGKAELMKVGIDRTTKRDRPNIAKAKEVDMTPEEPEYIQDDNDDLLSRF